jgi:hypothetical protein
MADTGIAMPGAAPQTMKMAAFLVFGTFLINGH